MMRSMMLAVLVAVLLAAMAGTAEAVAFGYPFYVTWDACSYDGGGWTGAVIHYFGGCWQI
jgi:hypothetical protein